MNDATVPAHLWQQLLTPFVFVLTQPGYARFAQWVTGTALGWEEHTLTQVLTSMGLDDRWRVDADPAAGRWWSLRPWNRHKSHPLLLDVRRAVWASRAEFSNFLRGLDGVRECDVAPQNHEGSAP